MITFHNEIDKELISSVSRLEQSELAGRMAPIDYNPDLFSTVIVYGSLYSDKIQVNFGNVFGDQYFFSTLFIEKEQINEVDAKYLLQTLKKSSKIKNLGLHNVHIDEAAAKYLADILSDLENLMLSNIMVVGNAAKILLEGLKHNKKIKRLQIEGLEIDDNTAKELAENLKQHQNLNFLSLINNAVWYRAAEYLAEGLRNNLSLDTLIVDNKRFNDEAAKYIASALKYNQRLKNLKLIGYMGSKASEYLSDAIKINQTLETLTFSGRFIGNEGAQFFAEALKYNRSLMHLDLNHNRITKLGVLYLIDALQDNFTLISFSPDFDCQFIINSLLEKNKVEYIQSINQLLFELNCGRPLMTLLAFREIFEFIGAGTTQKKQENESQIIKWHDEKQDTLISFTFKSKLETIGSLPKMHNSMETYVTKPIHPLQKSKKFNCCIIC